MKMKFTKDFCSDFINSFLYFRNMDEFNRPEILKVVSDAISSANKICIKENQIVIDTSDAFNTIYLGSVIAKSIIDNLYDKSDVDLMIKELGSVCNEIDTKDTLCLILDQYVNYPPLKLKDNFEVGAS